MSESIKIGLDQFENMIAATRFLMLYSRNLTNIVNSAEIIQCLPDELRKEIEKQQAAFLEMEKSWDAGKQFYRLTKSDRQC